MKAAQGLAGGVVACGVLNSREARPGLGECSGIGYAAGQTLELWAILGSGSGCDAQEMRPSKHELFDMPALTAKILVCAGEGEEQRLDVFQVTKRMTGAVVKMKDGPWAP